MKNPNPRMPLQLVDCLTWESIVLNENESEADLLEQNCHVCLHYGGGGRCNANQCFLSLYDHEDLLLLTDFIRIDDGGSC